VQREARGHTRVAGTELQIARESSARSLELDASRRPIPGRTFEACTLQTSAVEEHVLRKGVLDRDAEEEEDAEER